MNWNEEVIIILAFWALYGPFSLITWYETTKQHLIMDLVFILLIGVVLVALFVFVRLVIKLLSTKAAKPKLKKELEEKKETAVNPLKDVSPEQQFSLPPVNLDNVFKENFGQEVQDLD